MLFLYCMNYPFLHHVLMKITPFSFCFHTFVGIFLFERDYMASHSQKYRCSEAVWLPFEFRT